MAATSTVYTCPARPPVNVWAAGEWLRRNLTATCEQGGTRASRYPRFVGTIRHPAPVCSR